MPRAYYILRVIGLSGGVRAPLHIASYGSWNEGGSSILAIKNPKIRPPFQILKAHHFYFFSILILTESRLFLRDWRDGQGPSVPPKNREGANGMYRCLRTPNHLWINRSPGGLELMWGPLSFIKDMIAIERCSSGNTLELSPDGAELYNSKPGAYFTRINLD